MQQVALSIFCTLALGVGLARMDRDSAWRLMVMAALAASTVWMMWALVEVSPQGMRGPPAPVPPEADKNSWSEKIGRPGITPVRLALMGAILAVGLVFLPARHGAVRVAFAVMALILQALSLILGAIVAFAVFWAAGATAGWRYEIVLIVIMFVGAFIAMLRMGLYLPALYAPVPSVRGRKPQRGEGVQKREEDAR